MNKEITDALLREFLLGNVDDVIRDQIESLFLTDAQARKRVFTAEQDLIEDYLEDNLTTADKQRFLSRFAQTAAQRRDLRITKSIKEWARREAWEHSFPAKHSVWAGLSSQLRLKPLLFLPITVVVIIAVVLTVVWLRREQALSRHMEVERELARLNAPTTQRDQTAQMASLILSPLTVRSTGQQIEFKPRSDIRILELRLAWIQKEYYPTYQVQVRRVGVDESFTIQNLHADVDVRVVRVRLPANILSRGQYRVQLTGVGPDGSLGPTEEYTFVVAA